MGFEVFLDKFESFVGVNFWTMIFAWINLLIVYLILRKFLFAPIKNMIDSRQKEIDDIYLDAETSRSDAEKMRSDYEEKLAAANDKSEEIVKSAIRKAQLKEEEIIKGAGEEAGRIVKKAGVEAELEKKRILNEIKDEVSGMAIDIASAVIERDVNGDEHKAMIDSFIDSIGDGK